MIVQAREISEKVAIAIDSYVQFGTNNYEKAAGAVMDGLAASLLSHVGAERAAELFYRWADGCVECSPLPDDFLPPQTRDEEPAAPPSRWIVARGKILPTLRWANETIGMPAALLLGLWIGGL